VRLFPGEQTRQTLNYCELKAHAKNVGIRPLKAQARSCLRATARTLRSRCVNFRPQLQRCSNRRVPVHSKNVAIFEMVANMRAIILIFLKYIPMMAGILGCWLRRRSETRNVRNIRNKFRNKSFQKHAAVPQEPFGRHGSVEEEKTTKRH